MDQRTIPEDLQRTYETARGLGNSTGWLGPLGNQVVNLIERIALAESQAAELREEVGRQNAVNAELGDIGHSLRSEIATLRKQLYACVPASTTLALQRENADLKTALERQQRAVTDEEWDNRPSVEAGPSYWPRLITAILASRSREQEPGK